MKPARLRILYDVDGWAYHYRAKALQELAPADFEVSLAPLRHNDGAEFALGNTPADLVFVLNTRKTPVVRQVLQQKGWPSKLVAASNSGLPRALPEFFQLYEQADAWIINNQAYWVAVGQLPNTFMIPNGVDVGIFNVQRPPQLRTPLVLWTGSELHRKLKGYDDLIVPMQKQLRALGIASEALLVDSYGSHKRRPQQMAQWYNQGTVLVCASSSEGTPNPALEAAACGCTVVSTRVGNMTELIRHDVNGYLVDRNVPALVRAVQDACSNYLRLSQAMQSDIRAWSWADRSKEFYRVFREVLGPAPQPSVSRRDLSKSVTVFVTTVGAPSFAVCLERLRQQDCTYTLQIIDHIAPMHVAFQRMLDDCRTPYYVQVDEDMLLYPHAVRTLYETMASAAPSVAMCVADLYDAHLGRCILGVKIFRHEVVRRYPFAALDSFETEQLARLARDGYSDVRAVPGRTPVAGRTLGLHGMYWTLQGIYERYATAERRRRTRSGQVDWFAEYPALFLERFLQESSAENFFAVMGVMAGTLASAKGEARAKDYRGYGVLPGFQSLKRFLEEFEPAPSQAAP